MQQTHAQISTNKMLSRTNISQFFYQSFNNSGCIDKHVQKSRPVISTTQESYGMRTCGMLTETAQQCIGEGRHSIWLHKILQQWHSQTQIPYQCLMYYDVPFIIQFTAVQILYPQTLNKKYYIEKLHKNDKYMATFILQQQTRIYRAHINIIAHKKTLKNGINITKKQQIYGLFSCGRIIGYHFK